MSVKYSPYSSSALFTSKKFDVTPEIDTDSMSCPLLTLVVDDATGSTASIPSTLFISVSPKASSKTLSSRDEPEGKMLTMSIPPTFMLSVMDSLTDWPRFRMATTAATPMMIPSRDSRVLILLWTIEVSAIFMFSQTITAPPQSFRHG